MTASEVPTPEVIAAALAEAHREGMRGRARKLSDEFCWAMTEESIDGIVSLCAEAKAEGWDDAVKALRDCGLINAADWLDVNRPE